MFRNDDTNNCSIVVTGYELVELKRHARQMPECPDLERRIHKYKGKGSLTLSRDELDWLVAVLDAVLHDPKGYPCIEYGPWKVEYVPRTDVRCVTCQRLYDRLNQESERLSEISKEAGMRFQNQEQLHERRRAGRNQADETRSRIQAVFSKRGCPAIPARVNRGYTIYHQGEPVSRIRQRDERWEVLWWSHRGRWEAIGDLGGVVCDTVEEAAEYVLDDPMGIFWR